MSKLYKIKKLFWEYIYSVYRNGTWLEGPFCPKCFALLDEFYGRYKCSICEKDYQIDENFEKFREEAIKIFDAKKREKYEKVSLDEPPTHVKVRDSDDNYFIAAKIGQKNGERIGVVYFGEKNKDQKKKDYSQIFIDLDDEQLRFDKSNKNPKDVLCKFKAEFPDVIIDQKFK